MSELQDRWAKEREEFKAIQAKFPNLLKKTHSWGCGVGWHPLLTDLFETLESIIEYLPPEIKGDMYVVQIKEKFGTLRFHMNQETPEMSGAIRLAENISCRLCEHCGATGTRRGGGWILTLCDKCHEEREREKAEEKKKWAETNKVVAELEEEEESENE